MGGVGAAHGGKDADKTACHAPSCGRQWVPCDPCGHRRERRLGLGLGCVGGNCRADGRGVGGGVACDGHFDRHGGGARAVSPACPTLGRLSRGYRYAAWATIAVLIAVPRVRHAQVVFAVGAGAVNEN